MRTGIVTFHEAANYGAALQAYALQETLASLGADSHFITFAAPAGDPGLKTPEPDPRLLKYPRLALEQEKMRGYREQRNAIFYSFRERHLRCSRPYGAGEDIDADHERFIAGSDQIWNYEITGRDGRYFLDFARPAKRFAYAASFGLEALPEKLQPWYAERLGNFAAISVRELEGQDLVRGLTGRQVPLCLDPTLLLSAGQWDALTREDSLSGIQTDGYVLLYLINFEAELVRLAQRLAQERKLVLKTVTASLHPPLGAEAWTGTGVSELVLLAQQAAAVVTDSFHGLALALAFRKEFYLSAAALATPRSSRLRSLLHLLGCEAGEVTADGPSRVNWVQIENRLEAEQKRSLEYMRSIV